MSDRPPTIRELWEVADRHLHRRGVAGLKSIQLSRATHIDGYFLVIETDDGGRQVYRIDLLNVSLEEGSSGELQLEVLGRNQLPRR